MNIPIESTITHLYTCFHICMGLVAPKIFSLMLTSNRLIQCIIICQLNKTDFQRTYIHTQRNTPVIETLNTK